MICGDLKPVISLNRHIIYNISVFTLCKRSLSVFLCQYMCVCVCVCACVCVLESECVQKVHTEKRRVTHTPKQSIQTSIFEHKSPPVKKGRFAYIQKSTYTRGPMQAQSQRTQTHSVTQQHSRYT